MLRSAFGTSLKSSMVVLVAPTVTSLPWETRSTPFGASVHFATSVLVQSWSVSPRVSPTAFLPLVGAEECLSNDPFACEIIPVTIIYARVRKADFAGTS